MLDGAENFVLCSVLTADSFVLSRVFYARRVLYIQVHLILCLSMFLDLC